MRGSGYQEQLPAWTVVAIGALGAIAIGVCVSVLPVPHLLAGLAAPIALALASRVKWWRSLVVVSFTASLLRTNSEFSHLLGDQTWYVLQFAPIAILLAFQLMRTSPSDSWSRDRPSAITISLLLLVALAAASAIGSIVPGYSLTQAAAFALVAIFLCLTAASRWRHETVLYGDLTTIFAAASIAQSVGVYGQIAGYGWALADYGRFQGLMSNANFAGMLSAVTLPLTPYLLSGARLLRRAAIMMGAAALLSGLFLSGSRGALLAAVVGLILAALAPTQRRRSIRIAWICCGIAAGAYVFQPWVVNRVLAPFSRVAQGSDLTSGRIEIFAVVVERWQSSPWFGTGFRSVEHYFGEGFTSHNIYIAVLAELGVVGACTFAALITSIWLGRARVGRQAALIGAGAAVLVIELTESSLFGFGGPTALFSWLVLVAVGSSGRTVTLTTPLDNVKKDAASRISRARRSGPIAYAQ